MTPPDAAAMPPQDARRVLDVGVLPRTAFGHQALIWWGEAGFMVIEGSMFVIVLIVYFYLRLQVRDWPPSNENPLLLYGTVNLLLVFVSMIPAHIAKKKAEAFDLAGVRLWMGLLVLFGVVSLGLRVLEYYGLNCRWDDNAYGSIVWTLLSLHTLHVATDVVDDFVLLALAFLGPNTRNRFGDYSENSMYWYFIVAWWVPIYVTIYWLPRWL
jgi:heme/copper-type cytochrome/quinol oxidase subunit 3